MPDELWIAEQVRELASALRTDETKASQLLGELFDEIHVYRVTPPGKERGYHQLKFRLKASRIVMAALNGKLPASVQACLNDASVIGDESPEFCLNVGGPTRADEFGDYIVKRRLEGASWRKISEGTGVPKSTAEACFKRRVGDTNTEQTHGGELKSENSDGPSASDRTDPILS